MKNALLILAAGCCGALLTGLLRPDDAVWAQQQAGQPQMGQPIYAVGTGGSAPNQGNGAGPDLEPRSEGKKVKDRTGTVSI